MVVSIPHCHFKDGIVDEDEFVEGCLNDPNFLFMLEHFSCDFLWGNVDMH